MSRRSVEDGHVLHGHEMKQALSKFWMKSMVTFFQGSGLCWMDVISEAGVKWLD